MKSRLKKHYLFLLAILSLSSAGILVGSKDTPEMKKEGCVECPVASEVIKKFKELYKKEGSRESKFSTQTVRDDKEDLRISVHLPKKDDSEDSNLVNIELDTKVKSGDQFPDETKKRFLTPKLLEKYTSKQSWREYFQGGKEYFSPSPCKFPKPWRALDDCTQCQRYVSSEQGVWAWESKERFRCNIAVPRKIFNNILHTASPENGDRDDISSVVQQAKKTESKGNNHSPKESPKASKSNVVDNPFPQEECTPQEKNACYTLLRALLETNPIHKKDEEGNVTLDFDLPFSEKMKGYNQEAAALDKREYNGLPSPEVAGLCKDDVSCIATWFFWQKSHRPGKVQNQYCFGKNGQDGELILTSGGSGSAVVGEFTLSQEEFERLKKNLKE